MIIKANPANLCREAGGRATRGRVAQKVGFRGGELERWNRRGRGGGNSLHPKDMAQLTDCDVLLYIRNNTHTHLQREEHQKAVGGSAVFSVREPAEFVPHMTEQV